RTPRKKPSSNRLPNDVATTEKSLVRQRLFPSRGSVIALRALPIAGKGNRGVHASMKTQIAVVLAASVLALSACKNETPTAQQEAAEAQSAMEQAGDSAAAAMSDAGDALAEGADAAAASTGEAYSEVADATQAAAAEAAAATDAAAADAAAAADEAE